MTEAEVLLVCKEGEDRTIKKQEHAHPRSVSLLEACYAPCRATLRTVKRETGTGVATELVVRVLPDEPLAPPKRDEGGSGNTGAGGVGEANSGAHPEPPPVIDDLDDEQTPLKLCRSRLEALACDADLPSYLRNVKLQQVIRNVDAAPDREAALEQALVNPDFSAFCEKVLDIIAPRDENTNH